MSETPYIHYSPQHVWDNYEITILCGAEFTGGVTNSEGGVTCPVCVKLLKKERQDQMVSELLGGAESV